MAFTTNPQNDDTYTSSAGIKYGYNAAEERWTIVSAYILYGQAGVVGSGNRNNLFI